MDITSKNVKPNTDPGLAPSGSKYFVTRKRERKRRKYQLEPGAHRTDTALAEAGPELISTTKKSDGGKYLVRHAGQEPFASRYFDAPDVHTNVFRRAAIISIYLYIASLYVLSYWSQLNMISQALFVLMVLMTGLDVVIHRPHVDFDFTMVSMIAFIALYEASSFWVESQDSVSISMQTLAMMLILYMVLRLNIRSFADVHMLLMAITVGTLIMCGYTIIYYGPVQLFRGIVTGARLGQEINQANMMGIYNSILIAILLYYVMYERKRYMMLFIIPALVVLLAAGSRKGVLLLALAVVLMIIMRVKKRQRIVLISVLAIITVVMVALIFAFAETNIVFKRMAELLSLADEESYLTDMSIRTRRSMITYGLELFVQRPFFGYGPVQFEYFWSLFHGLRRPPHSTYIQVLVATGSAGFVLFYGQYGYYLRGFVRMAKARMRFMPLIGVLVAMMLFNDIGGSMLANKYTYVILAIIAGYFTQARKLYAAGKNDDDHYIIPPKEADEAASDG